MKIRKADKNIIARKYLRNFILLPHLKKKFIHLLPTYTQLFVPDFNITWTL